MKRLFLVWFIVLFCLPLSAIANTRLRMHVTTDEVNCWRQRAGIDSQGANGITCPVKYNTAGDVSTNSPGDWTRIVANKNTFTSSPSTGRWDGPLPTSTSSCVTTDVGGSQDPPQTTEDWANRMRDAAFFDLVSGITTHHAAIKAELLWIAGQARWNWANTAHWCTGMFDINPTFIITAWLSKILLAYDYTGRAAFTSGELSTLDTWFWNAADYWRLDMTNGANSVWSGGLAARLAGTATWGSSCNNSGALPYVGGPQPQDAAAIYSNRRASINRLVALVGIYLNSNSFTPSSTRTPGATTTTLMDDGRMFVKEWVKASLLPQGIFGDFNRADASLPDLGWAYGAAVLGDTLTIADHFARHGDPSLFQFTTSVGACNSGGTINDGGVAPDRTGQNKDLLFAMQALMKYHTDRYARYFQNSGNQDWRLDGRNPRNSPWSHHWVHETYVTPANLFFQDTFVKDAYQRLAASGSPVSYPPSPTGSSAVPPWTGANGLYPGVLFMTGQLEGVLDPYDLTDPPPITVPAAPTNLRVISP